MSKLIDAGAAIVNVTVNAIRTVDYNGYGPANASGQTAQSIGFVIDDRSLQIVSDGPAANYVLTLVHGRGPTAANGDGSVRKRIREWLDQKNIGEQSQRESMSYAITKSIHQKGTTLFQKGGNSPIFEALVSDDVTAMVTDAVADIYLELSGVTAF